MSREGARRAAWAADVEPWARWLRAGGLRPGTIRLRLHYVSQLAERFDRPGDVTEQDLADMLARSDWKPETRKSARTTYRAFFAWACRTGRVETDPAEHLAPVRVPRALPRPTPDAVIRDALCRADDARARLAVMLAAYAGLRAGEIAALSLADLRGDVLHLTGKGGRERVVPVHPDLAPALAEAVALRRAEDGSTARWLFPGVGGRHMTSGHVTRLVGRLFPDGSATTHALRHRFATTAYRSTHDLRAVQELLGHAKPETTARYAATSGDALRAAVAGVGL